MRISADDVDGDQACEGCELDAPDYPQNAKMTIVFNERRPDELYKNAVDFILQKFQDLNIHVDHDDGLGTSDGSEKLCEAKMEGAEGGPPAPPSCDPDAVSAMTYLPFWNKFKEELTEQITEDVLQKVRLELSENKQINVETSNKTCHHGTAEDVLHYGVYCDSCDQQIRGIRYKCGNCEDFDLCEKCESDNLQSKHDASHIFLKIRVPSCLFTMQEGSRKKIYQVPLRNSESGTLDLPFNKKGSTVATSQAIIDKECMKAKFICDESIPDGSSIAPGTEFVKIWRVCNSGTMPWTKDTVFRVLWSNQDLKPLCSEVPAPQLSCGEEGLVSVSFIAPTSSGHYESYWEFQHSRKSFGDTLWCRIRVEGVQPIEIFPLVVPSRHSALKALKLQHHQCLLKNKRKVKEEKRRKKESRKKDVKQIVDVLAAVHEDPDSHTRNIGQRKTLVTSQTATPNNTPFDLTPPKSPEPEEFVEIKNEISISTAESSGDQLIEVFTTDADDKASITTLSSSDSENEFVVIPMPKCFSILQREVAELSASKSGSDVEASPSSGPVATTEILITSEDVPQVSEGGENINLVTTLQLKEDCDKKIIVSNMSLSCSSSSSISVADNVGNSSPEIANQDEETRNCIIVADNVGNSSSEIANQDEEAENPAQLEQESHSSNMTSVTNATEDSEKASNCTFPKFPLNVEPQFTVAPEASAPLQEELTDPAAGVGVEVLPGNVVKNAFKAAATVYETARAVILNLHSGRSEEEETDSNAQLTPLEQLLEMGFCNRALNEQLLKANNYDVSRVVGELISLSDNDWYASRHATSSVQTPSPE